MAELTEGVNWLAVGVGTVLSFLLGWLWYSPCYLQDKWMEGVGMKPKMQKCRDSTAYRATDWNFPAGLGCWHRLPRKMPLLTIILIAAAIRCSYCREWNVQHEEPLCHRHRSRICCRHGRCHDCGAGNSLSYFPVPPVCSPSRVR